MKGIEKGISFLYTYLYLHLESYLMPRRETYTAIFPLHWGVCTPHLPSGDPARQPPQVDVHLFFILLRCKKLNVVFVRRNRLSFSVCVPMNLRASAFPSASVGFPSLFVTGRVLEHVCSYSCSLIRQWT